MNIFDNFGELAVDFYKDVAKFSKNGGMACVQGLRKASADLTTRLRDQILTAGMKQRLANTWQNKTRGGKQLVWPAQGGSFSPTALVLSKAPAIVDAFNRGVTIKSKNGFYLAIPTENAPKEYLGKKVTPHNWPVERYGKLRFVYRQHGASLLVADDLRGSYVRKTGALRGFKQATEKRKQSGKGLVSVVMFVLVKQVSLSKKLDVEGAVAQCIGELPGLISGEWKDE